MNYKKLKSFYWEITPPKEKQSQVRDNVREIIHRKPNKDPYLVPALFGLVALVVISISVFQQPKESMVQFQVESVITMENHTAIWLEPLTIQKGN